MLFINSTAKQYFVLWYLIRLDFLDKNISKKVFVRKQKHDRGELKILIPYLRFGHYWGILRVPQLWQFYRYKTDITRLFRLWIAHWQIYKISSLWKLWTSCRHRIFVIPLKLLDISFRLIVKNKTTKLGERRKKVLFAATKNISHKGAKNV